MAKPTNRVAWGLAVILAGVLLGATGLLFLRLRPYWIARYRGAGADLRQAFLPLAPLHAAILDHAHLQQANLQRADLRGADLRGTDPSAALLRGAIYDSHTRWPSGFDPERHGAVIMVAPH
jgi:hypothetical protein